MFFVFKGYHCSLFLWFLYWMLELLWQSDIFCVLIYFFFKTVIIHFLSQVILPWYALKIQYNLPLNNFKITKKKKTTTEKFTWLNYIYFVTEFVRFLTLKVCLTIDYLGTFSTNQSYISQSLEFTFNSLSIIIFHIPFNYDMERVNISSKDFLEINTISSRFILTYISNIM